MVNNQEQHLGKYRVLRLLGRGGFAVRHCRDAHHPGAGLPYRGARPARRGAAFLAGARACRAPADGPGEPGADARLPGERGVSDPPT